MILPLGERAQLDLLDAPAAMDQRSLEGGLASDIAGQADGGRVEAGGNFDLAVLVLGQHGLQNEMLLQGFLTLAVDLAYAGAQVLVGGGGDVFEQKVKKAAVALQ
jgi:hypothetical protein